MREPTKKLISDPRLKSWDDLNDSLRDATESECRELLKLETAGRNRAAFKKRIHSRLNKVRADREREELAKTSND